MLWAARIEHTRFSNRPQPPSPEPKSTSARAAPAGTKWYVPNGPRFSERVIVGASGSSAHNDSRFQEENKKAKELSLMPIHRLREENGTCLLKPPVCIAHPPGRTICMQCRLSASRNQLR